MAEDTKDFKVVDKRSFQIKEDGSVEPRGPSDCKEAGPSAQPAKPGPDRKASAPGPEPAKDAGPPPPREVTFAHVVLSLSASAYEFLEKGKDPQQAKYSIDALGVLQAKTRGNLTKEEEDLLTNVLFDLRMRYVQGVKK